MNSTSNLRNSVTFAFFAVVMSATCFLSVVAPAYAANHNVTSPACSASVALPLA